MLTDYEIDKIDTLSFPWDMITALFFIMDSTDCKRKVSEGCDKEKKVIFHAI